MNRLTRCFSQLMAGVTVLLLSISLNATVIDNTPPNFELAYFDFTGPDIAGGTFFADDVFLNSFSLNMVANNAGGTFSAVVMTLNGGVPDALIWASNITAIPNIATQLFFFPNLAINNGTEYFIGVDTGRLTAATGSFNLGFTFNNIAGQHWEDVNMNGWFTNPDHDIASRIVMSEVALQISEPPIFLMMIIFGMAALRKKYL